MPEPSAQPDLGVSEVWERFRRGPVPLTRTRGCPDEVQHLATAYPDQLFRGARNPAAALSGLMLILGCWEASHDLSQDDPSLEGSYWHAIVHRIEPDASNSKYWFRRVGEHPIFPELLTQTAELLRRTPDVLWKLKSSWDPALLIEWIEQARHRPGSEEAGLALAIQDVECRLLFHWCADPRS